MMTKEQYIDSLRGLHLNLYRFGEKVENVVDDPIVRPSLNSSPRPTSWRRTRSTRI